MTLSTPTPWLVGTILLLVTLAGCLGDDTPAPGPGDELVAPYALDCSIGGLIEPCLVIASPNDSPSKTEIDLVINPLDPMNVVVASKDLDPLASNDCVWAVAQVTHDGGHTWNTTYIGGKVDERQPGDLLYGWDCITDPIMTFNKDGTLFYNLQVYGINPTEQVSLEDPILGLGGGGLMALAISRDGGDTFPEIIPEFVGDDLAVFPDYMHMGTNPVTGTVFTIWNTLVGLVTSNPTLVAYRQDGFTEPHFFITPDSPTGTGESGVVGANDGTIYAWLGGFNSPDVAYYSISTDDGTTWTIPARAFDFVPMQTLPGVQFRHGTVVELAVDNSGGDNDGCLYATWNGNEQGATPAVDGSDIYVRRSCDKATAWDEVVLVNHDTRGGGQIMPRVEVDGRGGIHIVYLTQHHSGSHLLDAEWAHSTDGGTTWTTQRLTAASYDGDLGIHQNGSPFLGDYIGIDAVGDHVWMGFPTTITGRAEIAMAHVLATG